MPHLALASFMAPREPINMNRRRNHAKQIPPQANPITQSKTWKAKYFEETKNFERMKVLLRHFCPKSPFIPSSINDWTAHKTAISDMEMKKMKRKIQLKTQYKTVACAMSSGLFPEKGPFLDNRSAVLCQLTIWCAPAKVPLRENAAWPNREELKHEGEDRAKSKFGRFLPLPREVNGDVTSEWWEHQTLAPLSFLDDVGPLDEYGIPKRPMTKYTYQRDILDPMDIREVELWEPIHDIMQDFVQKIDEDTI